MPSVSNWPICLRLCAGPARLMLPAALLEQVLTCDPVDVPVAPEPGWQRLADVPGSAFTRIGFQCPGAGAWRATSMAVLRVLPPDVVGRRRLALLLDSAPRVLPPLAPIVIVSAHAPGGDTFARVQVEGEDLLVPDLYRLGGAGAMNNGCGDTSFKSTGLRYEGASP